MPVIGVKQQTYKRLKRIRDKLHFRSIEDVIVLLLNLYEDSITNINEILINLLTNTGRILDILEDVQKKIKPIYTTPIHSDVIIVQDERQNEDGTIDGLPSYLRNNPWVEILSKRGKN